VKIIIRAFAGAVSRAPWAVIALTVLLSLGFGALASTVENSDGQEGFAPESDEILASERIGELFGESATQSVMQVVVRSASGDVITGASVAATIDVVAAIEGSEAADLVSDSLDQPGVVSFMAPVLQGAGQQGIDPTTLDDAAVKQLYSDVLEAAGPELGFVQQLVPDDPNGSPDVGLILVFVDTSSDIDVQVEREKAIADAIRSVDTGGDLELRPFSFSLLFGEDVGFERELGRLFGTAFAIIIGVLLFVYWMKPRGTTTRRSGVRRTLADTSVTMLTIVLAILWMNGIGALLQRVGVLGPLTEVAQIVPILLIGLGVDYGIHLTSRYRDEVGDGATVTTGMRTAIGTVGVALALATLTTAIGFLTNIVNPIPALRDFGILAAIGIAVSFFLMMTFVPALRSILDRRAELGGRLPRDGMGATRERLLPELVSRTSILAEKAPIPTLVVMVILGGFGYLGLTNLSTEFSFTDFLPEDSPVVETLEIIEAEFGGGFGETTQVLVESDDVATPEVFNGLAEATDNMADTADVLTVPGPTGPAPSVNSPVSVVRALFLPAPDGTPADPAFAELAVRNGFDPETGRMSDDADVEAILEAAEDRAPDAMGAVLGYEDGEPTAALLEIGTQAGEDRALPLQDELNVDLQPVADAGGQATVTSQNIISGRIVESLSSSQVTSLMITLVAATLVLMLTFWIENRRPFLGVITMIPVALVVLWTFGLMYVSGIPFGPVTATLTGLAVGIGVPYTIHMARRFEEDRGNYDDVNDAIRETTRNTGGALAGSAFTTAAGFGILITSTLVPFQQMGQVTAYAIVLSLLGAVLVLPSLLVLWERYHRRKGDPVVEKETVSVA
jgi:uncharacterized protein